MPESKLQNARFPNGLEYPAMTSVDVHIFVFVMHCIPASLQIGMMDMLHRYFSSSYPDENSRTFFSLHYDTSVCRKTQNNVHVSTILCLEHTANNYQNMGDVIQSMRNFTIILDVNRPSSVPVDSTFYRLFQKLQPGGLLIIENLEHLHSMSPPMQQHEADKHDGNYNYQLFFYKSLLDLVNSFHIRGLGYYQGLSDTEKYYASWIKRINFDLSLQKKISRKA